MGISFEAFRSENRYRLSLFGLELGMVFKETTGMCESICLQMNQRDRVMRKFEMDFKKSFCRRSNVSNDDIISYRPGTSCSKGR